MLKLSGRDVLASPWSRSLDSDSWGSGEWADDFPTENFHSNLYYNPNGTEDNFNQIKFLLDPEEQTLWVAPKGGAPRRGFDSIDPLTPLRYWPPHHADISTALLEQDPELGESGDDFVAGFIDGSTGHWAVSGNYNEVKHGPLLRQRLNDMGIDLDRLQQVGHGGK